MPPLAPRGQQAPIRRVVKRTAPPVGPRDAIFATPAPKPYEPQIAAGKVAGPAVAQSKNYPAQVRKVTQKAYGQVYGPRPANRYESQVAQGQAAGPSISESKTVVRSGQQAQRAVAQAKQGKPFDPNHLRSAIASGIAPDIHEGDHGLFFLHHRRALLPDYNIALKPGKGANFTPNVNELHAIGTNAAATDAVTAPALKVLETTAVPSHAIAGLVSGKGAAYGISHKTNFGSLFKQAGLPKPLAGVAGFAADVATDPTTYVSFGAGAVARKAATDAAERVAAKAAAAGMSEAGQATVARAAAKRAAEAAAPGKGLTASFAGRQVPGVTRATAAAGRVVKQAASKAPSPVRGAGAFTRGVASDVRPTIAPAGADQAQFQAVRAASRGVRAQVNHQLAVIDSHARGLHDQIGPDNYANVIDAIEKRTVHRLPDNLKEPAVFLRSQFRHAAKLRKQAGLGEGSIRDYFPHAQHEPLVAGKGVDISLPAKKAKSSGRIVSYPSSAQQRTLRMPISEANPVLAAEDRGAFSTDIPLVYANYQRETAKTVASADLAKRLAQAGRPIKPGRDFQLRPGERVYQLGFSSSKGSHVVGQTKAGGEVVVRSPAGPGRLGLRPLSDTEATALAKPGSFHPGQYVALHGRVVEDAAAQAAPTQATTSIGRGIDRTTRAFKTVATATPGFHARNLVGDVQMGYLSQPGHRLPINLYQASRAIKGLHAQQKAAENLALGTDAAGRTIKVAGQQMPVNDFLKLAQTHGVTQAGYLTRELADLAAGATKGVGRAGRIRGAARKAGRAVTTGNPVGRALLQDRENLVRLATFKHGLDTGLSPHEAASLSLSTHIDYGDLTHVERTYARRLMPFYTFSARALPLHVNRLLTRPGKFANIEKAREEVGGTDASGYSPYVQRQVPFNVGKVGVTDSLPLNLLNEVPVSTSPSKYGSEIGQFTAGLVNPIIKDPAELYANRSFTFRNDLQDPKRPLVSAPDWVSGLPQGTKQRLGIVQGPDRRTGKKVWMWPGKVDYAMRQVALGPFNIAQQLATSGTGRTGQGRVTKLIAGATGVRITPRDKVTQQINGLYNDLNALTEKSAGMNQQGISAKNATPAYAKLQAQIHATETQIYALSKKRGDKVLPKVGAPPRPRGGGDVSAGFGGFGSGFGGGFN